MKNENIYHAGIVENIEGDKIFVNILTKSACAECHAKGMCTVADMKEKIIEIDLKGESNTYAIGDNVDVYYEQSKGMLAVLYGYVLPFIFFIFTLILANAFFKSEVYVGLLSISGVVLYYIILYLFRERIRAKFVFKIMKKHLIINYEN
ncbi:MAG: hypothetical protein A2X12_02365 [Bacteroidetes bacterium GWE2_29_8]|nr:MAG: hypothetical protein A2X12_02365 [Bacteroidetes bacterium GWE2_29_8]OFY14610.1 MAG: hypothetical protein A2X02_05950 [Bacteroidetes bacterium GWF2_29_10]